MIHEEVYEFFVIKFKTIQIRSCRSEVFQKSQNQKATEGIRVSRSVGMLPLEGSWIETSFSNREYLNWTSSTEIPIGRQLIAAAMVIGDNRIRFPKLVEEMDTPFALTEACFQNSFTKKG